MGTDSLNALIAQCASLKRSHCWAQNTEVGYAYDWAMFQRWCENFERPALPASSETVSLYLTDILTQGRKVTTAQRRVSAIAHFHQVSGVESPLGLEIWQLLTAVRRLRGEQPRQKRPLTVDQLRTITHALINEWTPQALRDRALLVVGFASALRRCSLVALLLDDVEFSERGVMLRIRREKQDQEGKGRLIGLPRGDCSATCPVQSLDDWLSVRGTDAGPLFTQIGNLQPLRPCVVGLIVKHAVIRLGLDPSYYAGHSLRSGFVTAAGEAGAGELVIAAQTGHRNMEVLRRYFRHSDIWRSNACAAIGL